MRNQAGNTCEQITAPYTLEKLIDHLSTVPETPFQRFLKANLNELNRIKADDKFLVHRINIVRLKLINPAILQGIPWKNVVKFAPWTKPYYQWLKCLNAGRNSRECLLPDHFLNWQSSIAQKTAA